MISATQDGLVVPVCPLRGVWTVVDLEKSKNMMRVGAIGATESRNKLGMLVEMSLQLSVAIGGT